MAPDKALGPDGFNVAFYKEHWDIVGDEISGTVIDVFNDGIASDSINVTNIVLIPKKSNPSLRSEFRLISLCNVLYKLISKVIANRMKPFLDHIIDPSQSAFIAGSSIFGKIYHVGT